MIVFLVLLPVAFALKPGGYAISFDKKGEMIWFNFTNGNMSYKPSLQFTNYINTTAVSVQDRVY